MNFSSRHFSPPHKKRTKEVVGKRDIPLTLNPIMLPSIVCVHSKALQRRFTNAVFAQSRNQSACRIRSFSAPPLRRNKKPKGDNLMLRVGAPFVLFSILSAWVVSNALDGKLREMEASQGKTSQSVRQASLAAEHDDMMERLNKIVAEDFDNTKRIKRPHEVLEERRREREKRNAWHRRAYRAVFGGEAQPEETKK